MSAIKNAIKKVRGAFQSPSRAELRTSRERRDALQNYVEGLLPAHLEDRLSVQIHPAVETAFVMPTDVGSIKEDTDLSKTQAQQLADRVDADFVLVITGQGVDVDKLSVNGEISGKHADYSVQLGLALHEILHILKTSFGPVNKLVRDEVAAANRDFVHELINAIEDGAIEREVRTNDDEWTGAAASRLILCRQHFMETVEDLSASDSEEWTFADALVNAILDEFVHRTGKVGAALDPDDDRVQFETEEEKKLFVDLNDEFYAFLAKVLQTRSDQSDELYSDDTGMSLLRAKYTVDFFTEQVQPRLEDLQDNDQQRDDKASHDGNSPRDDAESDSGDNRTDDQCGDSPETGQEDVENNAGGDGGGGEQQSPLGMNADEHNPYQPVQAHPDSLGGGGSGSKVSLDDLPDSPSNRDTENKSAQTESSAQESSDKSDEQVEDESSVRGSDTSVSEIAPADSADDTISADNLSDLVNNNREGSREQQLGLDAFNQQSPSGDGRKEEADQDDPSQVADSDSTDNEVGDSENGSVDESTNETSSRGSSHEKGADQPNTTPAAGEVKAQYPVESSSIDVDADTLTEDGDAAERQAEREAEPTVDNKGAKQLEQELEAISAALDSDPDTQGGDDNPVSDTNSSNGGPGSLENLSMLDESWTTAASTTHARWDDIERLAGPATETLEEVLSLERQQNARTGQTSGALDTSQAYRLNLGDTRAFKRELGGGEKRYLIVLILDRSSSMRGECISAATDAVGAFAKGAEDLGADVAIVDFCYNDARLVKPAALSLEKVDDAVLQKDVGGGTPLSDALTLATSVTETATERTQPLIVSVTDGKPKDIDACITEIQEAWIPMCGITIAVDCAEGNPPAKSERLAAEYDQHVTVYNRDNLIDQLDEFANYLGAY